MNDYLSRKFSLASAVLLASILVTSVLSNAAFASPVSLSKAQESMKDLTIISKSIVQDKSNENKAHGNSNGKGDGNNGKSANDDSDDNEKSEKGGHANKPHGKLKIKAKHNEGGVQIEEETDEGKRGKNADQSTSVNDDENSKRTGSGENDDQSFPSDFMLRVNGGVGTEKGSRSTSNSAKASMDLSASIIRLEGNHVRVNFEGTVTLGNDEYEITDGHGIIIFFKNPGKHFFRGIIHLVGSAVNTDNGSKYDFHLRAFLLPPGSDNDGNTSWTFIVAPAAKLGPKIRITQLVGELTEIDGSGTMPLPDRRLDHFAVSTIPSPVAAGALFNITISAINAQGKILKDYDGKIRITDSTGTVKPSTISSFKDGLFSGRLNITKAMTSDKLTITDSATGKRGTSNSFNVFAGSLAKVELTPSSIEIHPTQITQFVAKGFDKFGNELSGLDFTWALSSSDFGSISTSRNNANFTASSSITTTVNVTLTAKIGNISDKSKITISPPTNQLDHFVIGNISNPKVAGTLFKITITAVNSTGNVMKTYDSSFKLIDTTGSLNITNAGGFTNGVWSGNVNITKADKDVKITARDSTHPSIKGSSNPFDVTANSIARLELSPSSITVQPSQKTMFMAKGFDKFGNEIAGESFSWSLSSPGFGSIDTSGNRANFTASALITATANVTLIASAGGLTDNSKITIQPTALQSLDHFVLNAMSPQKAGMPFPLSITAVDSSGNIITSYNRDIDLNDTTNTLQILTDSGFSSGNWTGNVMITKASQNVKITTNDKEITSKKGTSNPFVVRAGNLDHFEIANLLNTQVAGEEFAYAAIALDEFENIVQDYNGTVTLSTNDGTSPSGNESQLSPSPYTFNSDDEGQHTFQAKLYNAKDKALISIAGSGKNGTSHTFKVFPSATAKVAISPDSISVVKSKKATFHAEAEDAFGNPISDAIFAWSLSSSLLGSLNVNSGPTVDFTATATISGPLTGSIIVNVGSLTDTAEIIVTLA